MAEEKKEEVKEEAPQAQETVDATGVGETKKKKISRLSEKELNEKITQARQKMGGDHSDYVQHLLKRKAALTA